MEHSWQTLRSMIGERRFLITQVYLPDEKITLEGSFQLPPFAELGMDDQIFIAAFIKTNGSIKQMESIFNISYPTVKSRLHRIAKLLDIVDIEVQRSSPLDDILSQLEAGTISVSDALQEIE